MAPKPGIIDQQPANGPSNTIDQVRELLFGETRREHDSRFTDLQEALERLEAKMFERSALVEGGSRQATDALDRRLTKDVETLAAETTSEITGLDRRLSDAIATLETRTDERFAQMENKLADTTAALRAEKAKSFARLGKLLGELGAAMSEEGVAHDHASRQRD